MAKVISEEDLCGQVVDLHSSDEYGLWEQRCDELIESLENQSRIKRPRLSISHRQSVIAKIARLEGLKATLRERFLHEGAGTVRELIWREIDTAFENRIFTGAIINRNHIEPRQFLLDARDMVVEKIQNVLEKLSSVKVNTVFNGEFVAGDKNANKSINTKNIDIFRESDLGEWYEKRVLEPTLASLEEFQERDSGWALSRILNLMVNVNKYNPMRAGCHTILPPEVQRKRAVVNVKSMDEACFAWSIVAALYPAEKKCDREASYPHYSTVLNLNNITFPVTLNQIKKFEQSNDISVNVYTVEERKILPIRLSECTKNRHVNLLYVSSDNGAGHFAWIRNLSRLVSSQLSKREHQSYICDRCLSYFHSADKLRVHRLDCDKLNDCAIRLPGERDKWLSFKNFNQKERLPFIVYADLECVLEKTDQTSDQENSYQHHHRVFSAAYYVHCSYDNSLSVYKSRRGVDCVAWFVEELKNLALSVQDILMKNVPMVKLTQAEWENFRKASKCHICDRNFEHDDLRVRDHCHLTGRYRQ